MDDIFALTVRFKHGATGCTAAHSYAEIIAPKDIHTPRGFCLNEACKYRGYSCFKIGKSVFFDIYFTDKNKIIECPHCEHYLYWAKNFETRSREETKKNKRFYRRIL